MIGREKLHFHLAWSQEWAVLCRWRDVRPTTSRRRKRWTRRMEDDVLLDMEKKHSTERIKNSCFFGRRNVSCYLIWLRQPKTSHNSYKLLLLQGWIFFIFLITFPSWSDGLTKLFPICFSSLDLGHNEFPDIFLLFVKNKSKFTNFPGRPNL